uniref:Uncharacterized protein n=1 Tax=Hyaloperonospora arabidopsidis (strain Emoy2) TaxID=559515 RepID=M4BIL2_HYAAE
MDAYHREQYETQESRESKWKAIKQRHDLTVYRRRKVTSDKEYKYLLTGRMDGTLDEVVMGRCLSSRSCRLCRARSDQDSESREPLLSLVF